MKHVVRLLLVTGVVVALCASAVPSLAAQPQGSERQDEQTLSQRDARTIQGQQAQATDTAATTPRVGGAERRDVDRSNKVEQTSLNKRWWWWWGYGGGSGSNDEDGDGDMSPTDNDEDDE
jgi:type II secretory pathway pseudopilin PulG